MGKTLRKRRTHKAIKAKPKRTHNNTVRKKLNKKSITHPGLKEVWDGEKTYAQNMASIDLSKVMADELPETVPDRARHTVKYLIIVVLVFFDTSILRIGITMLILSLLSVFNLSLKLSKHKGCGILRDIVANEFQKCMFFKRIETIENSKNQK